MFKISICFLNFMVLLILSILMFLLSIYFMFFEFVIFIEWELLTIHSLEIVMTFLFDWMCFLFMSFVLFISSLVIFYSKDYMKEDKSIIRFILLVVMFVFSMMMLIISPNLISILLGWDGLGLVSYCLVIYFQNVKSYNAGMLTALSNRIGDVALLMAIAWMMNYGSWNYIFYIEMMKMDYSMKIIGGLVILAAMTKSAQIPFSSWLPAAMAAPTPVSALVHSSTLVTAGVYLLIRFNIMFVETMLSNILLFMGGLTMFMAGISANFEFDLKKIIALSTLSQLGLMMSILAMGFPKLAFFHLLTHALFKALLFMCAGAMIHNMSNSQDIRDMGVLSKFMPFTTSCLNISNLALCGMPFLAGFYSKDLILEMASMSFVNLLSFFLFFISTGLTVSYSFRLIYYSLSGGFNFSSLNNLLDESWIMSKSMCVLVVFSIIGGALLSWLMFSSFYIICLSMFFKNLIIIVCLIGGMVGYLMSLKVYFMPVNNYMYIMLMKTFNSYMWFMPLLSTVGLIPFSLFMGKMTLSVADFGWSEYLGGQYMYKFLSNYSMMNQSLQNNNLKVYLMMFIFWILFLGTMLFI